MEVKTFCHCIYRLIQVTLYHHTLIFTLLSRVKNCVLTVSILLVISFFIFFSLSWSLLSITCILNCAVNLHGILIRILYPVSKDTFSHLLVLFCPVIKVYFFFPLLHISTHRELEIQVSHTLFCITWPLLSFTHRILLGKHLSYSCVNFSFTRQITSGNNIRSKCVHVCLCRSLLPFFPLSFFSYSTLEDESLALELHNACTLSVSLSFSTLSSNVTNEWRSLTQFNFETHSHWMQRDTREHRKCLWVDEWERERERQRE